MKVFRLKVCLFILGLSFPFSILAQVQVFPEGYLSAADLRSFNPDLANQIERVLSSVVTIRILDPLGNSIGAASGFVLENEKEPFVRTAYHVLKHLFSQDGKCQDEKGTIEVSGTGSVQPETLTCASISDLTSKELDSATLKVSTQWKALPVPNSEMIEVGDKILVVGFPEIYSEGPVVSIGHVLFPIDQTKKRIATTLSVSPGLSGAVALKISSDGRLSLFGHVVQELNANPLVNLQFKYNWGSKTVQSRSVCLSQEELNQVMYNGSRNDVSFQKRVLLTTHYLLDRSPCKSKGWKWSDQISISLGHYRQLIAGFKNRKEFMARYLDILQADPLKALKLVDFPLEPSGEALSPEILQASLTESSNQLSRFEEKLNRVKNLYPSSGLVSDWLKAIDKLNLQHDLKAVNDHFIFGIGIVQLW